MDDQVFLDENDVTVTRDQLVVADASFRIREIRRVGVIKRRRSRLPPILLAMVGLAMWIPDTEAWWIGYAGLVIVACLMLLRFRNWRRIPGAVVLEQP